MEDFKHYIVKIIHEETITSPYDGSQYCRVKFIENYEGVEEFSKQMFRKENWEKVKADGYYIDME